jgi:hypothetical protein
MTGSTPALVWGFIAALLAFATLAAPEFAAEICGRTVPAKQGWP